MLELYEYDNSKRLAILNDASNVKITREINGEYSLLFSHLKDEKSDIISENRLIKCEGQLFRIEKKSKSTGGGTTFMYECPHVYNYDAKKIHLQNVPDFIGKQPYEVLSYIFNGTKFSLFSDEELQELGMSRVDADGFLIDFFSIDKTTPFDVVNTIIENCGKGEIYADNYKVALVERIGKDTNVSLKPSVNIQGIEIERDIRDLVTRLYPYGYEDLHIGTINGGLQYLDSPNIALYGIQEGYKDYSDYKIPEDVMNLGLWEFDVENRERIDVPSINISGKLIDLSKITSFGNIYEVNMGDSVEVDDEGTKIYERIIRIEKYPYEPLSGGVSIGRIRKDLFFYLNQMGKLSRNYKRTTTASGNIKATAISGTVSADGINVKDSDGNLTVLTDMITISDSNGLRFQCGLSGSAFVFNLYDKNGNAIYLKDDTMQIRGNIQADALEIGGLPVTTDSAGNVYINGKKIVTEETE